MSELTPSVSSRLNQLLAEAGLAPLDPTQAARFSDFLSLLIRWNARINLTAIRDEEGILSRHFVESIACAHALPAGIATLLDFGSGAGFPGIPIALCRPEISVTLSESHGRKAAFLHEAVRVLGLSTEVHAGRAEDISTKFDCVTLRAVDRMPQAVRAATQLVGLQGWLAFMTTSAQSADLKAAAGPEFSWGPDADLPGSENRVLALGKIQR